VVVTHQLMAERVGGPDLTTRPTNVK